MSWIFQKKEFSTLTNLLVLSFILLLAGCASTEKVNTENHVVEIEENDDDNDPFEGMNRKSHAFNEAVDDYVAAPISDAYKWITPQFAQTGVANFFSNLKEINVFLNDMMQGKFAQGAADGGRFLINSSIGLGGLFDVASEMGLERHEEDFAQTLAVWGVPAGPYLVVPLLGPMTTRGIPGTIFDTAANPASYIGLPVQFIPIHFLQAVNTRATLDSSIKFIDEAALDPYVFTRESFLQYRKYLISDGKANIEDDLMDLEDDFYLDDEEFSEETGLEKSITKGDEDKATNF